MKTINFPYLALGLAATILLIVIRGGQLDAQGNTTLPLLTLLVMSEFAFFVTAIASYIGIKHLFAAGFKLLYAVTTLLCLVLSLRFLYMGVMLWPL